jgi:H+/Cl- antiporter ClcA
MAAVPGAAAAVPFSIIAIVGFAVTLEPSNIAPIGVAVLTSYLIVFGLGLAGRAQAAETPRPRESSPEPDGHA